MRSPPPYLKTGRRTWWNCTMCIGGPSASGSRASGCASCPGLPEREGARGEHVRVRSEEHTSELQSRLHLVCRLLLEKKNRNKTVLGVSLASLFSESRQ